MPQFSRARRLCTAAISLLGAALLFRPQIAQGLILRGDDYLYRGDDSAALSRYTRALLLDPDNGDAADRAVFVQMERHTRASLTRGIDIATQYLRRRRDDPAVLADRALCRLIERDYAGARADFEDAALVARDARYFTFAGWAAFHMGDRSGARRLWREAVSADRAFTPAKLALARAR